MRHYEQIIEKNKRGEGFELELNFFFSKFPDVDRQSRHFGERSSRVNKSNNTAVHFFFCSFRFRDSLVSQSFHLFAAIDARNTK